MKNLILVLVLLCHTDMIHASVIKQAKSSPSVFIQNKGQWNNDVLYLARTKGMNAWITKQGIRYDFHTIESDPKDKNIQKFSNEKNISNTRICGNVIDMVCVGGNATAEAPNGLQKSYYNYIIGNDKSKWAGYVPAFSDITRQNVYRGIDERLYFEDGYMRYDFIIAPGGNPHDIMLGFKGAKGVRINSNGELVLQTSIGDVVQQKLFAYQMSGREKQQVQCTFVEKPGGKIGFQLANYDRTKPLVIDPLVYSSFIGGADYDNCIKIVLDAGGNPIITGITKSTNFPVLLGSYDQMYDGKEDCFVAKFNTDLSNLIFCTYYGGALDDKAKSCVVDGIGNVVICGMTFSANLPNINVGYDQSYNSNGDGFIAKISYSGSELLYSTYLGGPSSDAINDIAIVPISNEVVVTGSTNSSNFPTTSGALRTANRILSDGFVTKVNESGTALVFSTLLGLDSTNDECYGIALDKNNYPIVVGTTVNGKVFDKNFGDNPIPVYISFTTTGSAYRKTNTHVDINDGFLVKLGINGESLVYSTLIGGDSNDRCLKVAVDDQGIAAVCGITASDAGFNPTGFDKIFGGALESFVIRLSTSGGTPIYSTYIGGSSDYDEVSSIQYYDATGSVIVGGFTLSPDFPTGKIKDFDYHAYREGFVVQIDGTGNSAQYSAFVGGASNDEINDIAISSTGTVFVTGNTYSTDFPTSSNAIFKQNTGDVDGFVMALSTCTVTIEPPKDTLVCPGKPLTLTNNATGVGTLHYKWEDVASGIVGDKSSVTVIPTVPTRYLLTVSDDNCTSKTISYTVSTKPIPNINTIAEKKTCIGTSLKLSATADPTSIITWYDAIDAITPIATGNTYSTPTLTTSTTLYVESEDTTTKCTSGRKPIKISVVSPPLEPNADKASICANNSATLTAIFPSDVNYRWYDSLTGGKLLQVGSTFTTPKVMTTTVYYLESWDTTSNCISAKRSPITVTVLPSPNPIIQGQNAACVNSAGLVYSVTSNPKREYTWSITPNGTITSETEKNTITVSWSALGTGVISLTEKDLGSNCTKDVVYPVNISNELSSTLIVTGSTNLCTGDSVILDAGAGYSSYKWSSGETSQTIVVKAAGNYSVAMQDASGCKGSSNIVAVTLSTRPTPMITGKNTTCVNGNPIQYSVTPVAVNSYTWEVSSEGTITYGQGSSKITVNWTSAGAGIVKVIESSSSCTAENTMPVTVSSSLSPKITASGDTTLCEGKSVVLDAGNFQSYKWSSGETTPTITVTKAGSYTVEITDAGGCKGISEPMIVTVTSLPVPNIIASGKTEFCEGDSVILDAGIFNSYLWSNGATSKTVVVKTTGIYSVTVTNSSGCIGTSPTQMVTVSPLPPVPVITQKGDDSLMVNPYDASNIYSWRLDGKSTGQSDQTVYAASDGIYTIEVTNASGCRSTSLPFSYTKPGSAAMTVEISPSVIEGIAGEVIKIPLVITSSKNLTQVTASAFTAEVSVEPTLLVPNSGTSVIDNLNRRVVTVSGTRIDGNNTLAILEMKAGLGEKETSSIVVKSLVFQNGAVKVTTGNGEFHLREICKDGGTRLYKTGAVLSLSIQPNPTSETITMHITAAENGIHKVTLTNTLGEEVKGLFDGDISEQTEIKGSLTDIPAGVYFVVVQSPSQVLVDRVLIAK